MRLTKILIAFILTAAAGAAVAQGVRSPPRLVASELDPAPWNVNSGGIAACDVRLDERGAVTSSELVQDVAPYGAMLSEAVRSWRFEPAREDGRGVASRVLVLGFFRPPTLSFPAPESPRYKSTVAPEELPWPTAVAVPPYPPNALGSAKVVLEADISEAGAVTHARLRTGPTPFDSAATDALRKWTFRPAKRGGRPVAARAFLVFSFIGVTP
jgi:TonB family protein